MVKRHGRHFMYLLLTFHTHYLVNSRLVSVFDQRGTRYHISTHQFVRIILKVSDAFASLSPSLL
jgi:hypothetical protein